jgi:hypothetical protein
MSTELTHEPEPIEDDGFAGSLNSGRVLKGTFLKWTDASHWQDRDGLTPPSPLLVIAVKELLQKWKNGQAEVITEHPLPNAATLNSAIPESEWEIGKDGQPQKPWKHTIAIYAVSPATGALFTYMAATIGAHIAYDALKEAVVTMRALRGSRVMPLVLLAERQMKTKFGMKLRPHFEIVSWKTPGDDNGALAAKPAPQLTGPVTAPASATAAVVKTPTQAKSKKSAAKLSAETLASMGDVKPATSGEIFDDEIPW